MLPSHPAILVSFINTHLRDGEFDDLQDLCSYYDRDMESLLQTLSDAGYAYDPVSRSFRER